MGDQRRILKLIGAFAGCADESSRMRIADELFEEGLDVLSPLIAALADPRLPVVAGVARTLSRFRRRGSEAVPQLFRVKELMGQRLKEQIEQRNKLQPESAERAEVSKVVLDIQDVLHAVGYALIEIHGSEWRMPS